MAIPSFPARGPGGVFLDIAKAKNEYQNALHETEYNKQKAKYAPLTLPAGALSQLTYAAGMIPQYQAKALSNPAFVANFLKSNPGATKDMLNNIATYAQGNGSGNSMNLPFGLKMPQDEQEPSLANKFGNALLGAFGIKRPTPQSNALTQQPNYQGGQPNLIDIPGSHQFGGPNDTASNAEVERVANRGANNNQQTEVEPGVEYTKPGTPSPLTDDDLRSKSADTLWDMYAKGNPATKQRILDFKNGNQNNNAQTEPKSIANTPVPVNTKNDNYDENSWFANLGKQLGLQEELKEAGPIRIKQIEKLDEIVDNAKEKQFTLDEVSDLLASPTFEEIKKIPFAGQHEMSWYANEGTDEQKDVAGKYIASTGEIIKNSSRDFAGQFRQGEQALLTSMKPGAELPAYAKGKTEALSMMNRMVMERARLTSKIMSKYHIGKLEASDLADKRLKGDKIRQEIRARLHPEKKVINTKSINGKSYVQYANGEVHEVKSE
jgi:hypothetical protein